METLQQFFITVIATFVVFIVIARIAIATATNDNHDHHILKSSINEKTSTKTNTKKKKVRFAVDNDEYVVNKIILEPSETQSVVFDEPTDQDDLVVDYQTENVGSIYSKDEICVKLMCDDEDLKEKEGLVSDEDDDDSIDDDGWEGIERSEWEKVLGFVSSYGKVDDDHLKSNSLESDARMELYGRATEGACHDQAQPSYAYGV